MHLHPRGYLKIAIGGALTNDDNQLFLLKRLNFSHPAQLSLFPDNFMRKELAAFRNKRFNWCSD